MMNNSFSIILILIYILIGPKMSAAQITFSEIMYDVATDEFHDEFIEIFNNSFFDSADVTGMQFSDGEGVDILLPMEGISKIPPRSFAVILDGSYSQNSSTYDSVIPDSALILTISDKSFGKNGLSNTKSEYLTLSDSTGMILSSYSYTVGYPPGRSDEKIDLDGINDQTNWDESKIQGGTPGWKNSVSPLAYDYGIDDSSIKLPEKIFENSTLEISVEIYQWGKIFLSDTMKIRVFWDVNNDTLFQENDIIIGEKIIRTSAQLIDFEWHHLSTGIHHLVIEILCERDQNKENNLVSKSIEVWGIGQEVVVNEIKFLTDENEAEWLELYNVGKEDIYLKGWSLADKTDTVMIDAAVYISPNEYLVVSKALPPPEFQLKDEDLIILKKFITFNDQGDEICFISPSGEEVEKISYEQDWLEEEVYRYPSLERINPHLAANKAENWGPSMSSSGATPGARNSIYSSLPDETSQIIASPDPFSPDGDGVDDVTLISGEIPGARGRIRARIFDVRGRQIRILSENEFTGNRFNFIWNGKDDSGNLARIGIYIVFIQVINDFQGTLYEMKTTVILAQKL